jgi:glycerol-1-phosphate dehydrogenase [NAD(P)+]
MSRQRLDAALRAARDTKHLELGRGAIARTDEIFRQQFRDAQAIVVADENTVRFAGGINARLRFVFDDPKLYAEHSYVEQLQSELAKSEAIPVAVGSGTINDLTKLAAHRLARPYMCVATAASMDGYTAYGASITYRGSKQTFDCPAPRAVVADIDIIENAPSEMTASGYADLLAKNTAGADWILADALGIEAIDPFAWESVQGGLREALQHPINIEKLTEGLMLGGFAMQAAQSSRPASGAEHQFSHLWDMQHATDASHGFKVGIGTLAVAEFYEKLFEIPIENLNVPSYATDWPDWPQVERRIIASFEQPELREKALQETRAKWIDNETMQDRLWRLTDVWPDLKRRLQQHLYPSSQIRSMLQSAGAPTSCEQIGISRQKLHESFRLAYYIRRRFTVLDLGESIGVLP